MTLPPGITLVQLSLPLPEPWGTPAPEVFDHPVTTASLTRFLAQPGRVLLLAYHGPLIVGQLTAYVCTPPEERPPSVFIDELGITPSHQRRGIGRALVDYLLQLMPTLGAQEVWVAAEPTNQPAQALYASVFHAPESALIYTYRLGGSADSAVE